MDSYCELECLRRTHNLSSHWVGTGHLGRRWLKWKYRGGNEHLSSGTARRGLCHMVLREEERCRL